LSVGREEPSSGYTAGGVNHPLLYMQYAPTNYALTLAGEALEIWAIQTKPLKGKIQMFWAVFGFGYRSDLVVMEWDQNAKRRGVTAKVYLEVLAKYLPIILEYNSVFMQDNTPIYKAYKVIAFFAEMGIEVMPWPPYLPDLNPIENLGKMLKAEIDRAHPELKGMGNSQATMDFMIECA
jgi:DDE superfamily endonuclease